MDFLRRTIPFRARVFLLCLASSASAFAQNQLPSSPEKADGLQQIARSFEAARATPSDLRAFLVRMPKGADLHNHLSGAIYAESWIRAAAEDQLCVDRATFSFVKPAVGAKPCQDGQVLAGQAYNDQHLYDGLIDAFSMRGFMPSSGVTGHDHFFDAFDKFSGTDPRHEGEWLDEIATRASAQNEQYLELMETPDFRHAVAIAKEVGWRDDLAQLRDQLLSRGLRDEVAVDRAQFDRAAALRSERERCGQPDALPACRVEIRYLYQILRDFPKEQVFAQTLLGFETASADPRIVGINYVMPEDGTISMADYALQMRMVGFLHRLYPQVHISLHAGELAPGLVPYEGLCCHIRLAIEQAHAERIGHGVDVMYEDRPYELLKEMSARHVMVEINLTSEDVILGVSGKDHPFVTYRKFNVPVALSTDDEGVSRIDLTHEFVRAVEAYNLHYDDLKKLVRTGIEHAFLPGASLWSAPDAFARPVPACSGDTLGRDKPSAGCAAFLRSSAKAQQEWELERRFRVFESGS